MKKILLFLLFPLFVFGQTYIHNILCTDNAATTVVTNNGTGAAWIGGVNTNVIYSALNDVCFLLDTDAEYIKSAENLTVSEFYIQFKAKTINNTAAANEVYLVINGDADRNQDNNKILLYRFATASQLSIYIKNSAGTAFYKTTTDAVTSNALIHTYLIYFNLLTYIIKMWEDGNELSFGEWTATPAGTVTLNSGPIHIGTSGDYEPDAYLKDILFYLPFSTGDNKEFKKYKRFKRFKKF